MELSSHLRDNLNYGAFSGPKVLSAHIQYDALAIRNKLAFDTSNRLTSSITATPDYIPGITLDTSTSVTAGVDDFMSQQLAQNEKQAKRWDFRGYFIQNMTTITQQLSGHIVTGITLSGLLSYIRNHVYLPYSASLANRLEYLQEEGVGEAPQQAPISVNSVQSLVTFITKENNLTEPGLVSTYAGNIRAEWRKSRKEHFAVEFLPNGQVHYVVFSSDVTHKKRIDRTSGIVYAETLMSKIRPFNVLSWAGIKQHER